MKLFIFLSLVSTSFSVENNPLDDKKDVLSQFSSQNEEGTNLAPLFDFYNNEKVIEEKKDFLESVVPHFENNLNVKKSTLTFSYPLKKQELEGLETYVESGHFKNVKDLMVIFNAELSLQELYFKTPFVDQFTKHFPLLKKLELRMNGGGRGDVMDFVSEPISSLINLKELTLRDIFSMRSFANHLLKVGCLPNLKKLGLMDLYKVNRGEMEALASAFKKKCLPRLKSLNLSSNTMKTGPICVLADMIKEKYFFHLKHLDLSNNKPRYKGIKALTQAIQTGDLCHLKTLNMSDSNLGPDEISLICGVIANGYLPEIEELDIFKGNNLQNHDMQTFIQALKSGHLKNLKKLNFTGCHVTSDAMKSFVKSVQMNSLEKLTDLSFSNSQIDSCGIEFLAEAFQENLFPHIKKLYLHENNITSKGMKIFNRAVEKTSPKYLTELCIHQNYIGLADIDAFVDLVKKGLLPRLESLQLYEQREESFEVAPILKEKFPDLEIH